MKSLREENAALRALTAKFCDLLPLYRQGRMLAAGACPSSGGASAWFGAVTAWLEPLVKRIKQDLFATGYVQVDETPICCDDPDLRDGKTWALSRPGGDVVLEWRLPRRHEEAGRLLGHDFRGLLRSDITRFSCPGCFDLSLVWHDILVRSGFRLPYSI